MDDEKSEGPRETERQRESEKDREMQRERETEKGERESVYLFFFLLRVYLSI